MKKKILILSLILILVFSFTTAVFAQDELQPCSELELGDQVSGTVVEYDPETDTATIDTGTELCTVTFKQDYGHPITTLLGNYFSNFNSTNLAESLETLETTQVCLVPVVVNEGTEEETVEWSQYETAEGEECPGVLANVSGQNEDGSYVLKFNVGGEDQEVNLMVDEETAAKLSDAFESLSGEWGLNEDGSAKDVGDDIAQYHEDGFGFGVIVKIYGMAMASQEECKTDGVLVEVTATDEEPSGEEEPCGLEVADLFQAFEEGTGMGQLFKEYGKPAFVGVGHVKKAAAEDSSTSEACNPHANENSAVACPQETSEIEEADSSNDNANANPNSNKNKDKEKTNNGKKPDKD